MSGERLVERSERFAAAEAVRRAQTRQGRFEAGFLSLDWIDAKGDLRDYGDCGRAERQLFRQLDTPFREHVRELRWWRAMNSLKGRPELQRTLRAIRRHRVREKIFSALKIKGEVYRRRFFEITKILKISI